MGLLIPSGEKMPDSGTKLRYQGRITRKENLKDWRKLTNRLPLQNKNITELA